MKYRSTSAPLLPCTCLQQAGLRQTRRLQVLGYILHNIFYITRFFLDSAKESIAMIDQSDIMVQLKIQEIEKYITHAERQIDQVYRRVVGGETIPHHEKVLKSVCIPGKGALPVC